MTPDVTVWQTYDPKVKAELSATAVATMSGTYVVDPIAFAPAQIDHFRKAHRIAKIIVTNENHLRAAGELSARAGVPIYAAAGARAAFGEIPVRELWPGEETLPDMQVIALEGAAGGEIALHDARNGGTMIVGDALINFGSNGFALLPAKYCRNAKLLRKSLRTLLDFHFERLLFAHGAPIVSDAHSRLAVLLDGQ